MHTGVWEREGRGGLETDAADRENQIGLKRREGIRKEKGHGKRKVLYDYSDCLYFRETPHRQQL